MAKDIRFETPLMWSNSRDLGAGRRLASWIRTAAKRPEPGYNGIKGDGCGQWLNQSEANGPELSILARASSAGGWRK